MSFDLKSLAAASLMLLWGDLSAVSADAASADASSADAAAVPASAESSPDASVAEPSPVATDRSSGAPALPLPIRCLSTPLPSPSLLKQRKVVLPSRSSN